MALKKYKNDSWVDIPYKRYETGTDTVTTLPVTIFTDGQPVSSYIIKGNTTVSSGTPSPSTPVTISGVGEQVISGEHSGQYKISISSNQQALTPMYLTEQLMKINDYTDSLASSGMVTRNIYKIIFTGNETWYKATLGSDNIFFTYLSEDAAIGNCLCTHNSRVVIVSDGSMRLFRFYDADATWEDTTAFKTWLTTQYNNGTPVTSYYVLATPTTESVTAPIIPTTGGEVTLDTDTTVKPSEFDLTYHGWHSHEPKKYHNGSWE